MLLKPGHFGKLIRNTWKVLKCGAGEGWRRSARLIRVINEEVLKRANEERNILYTINRGNANWICPIFCRNCVLKHATENRRIKMTRRRGRRKQLLDDLKITRGYQILKEEALDRLLWRTRYGPVVRLQNACKHK
jgi:hypothetical protein